jgi:hypothetical protein
MSKDSSFLTFAAGVAAGVLVAALARTEEGRKLGKKVKSTVLGGFDKLDDLLAKKTDDEFEAGFEDAFEDGQEAQAPASEEAA